MKPRAAFFIDGLRTGGAERHTLELASRLRADFDCRLIVYGGKATDADVHLAGLDLPVDFAGGRRLLEPAAWLRTAALLRAAAPDIIVAANYTPLIVGAATRLLFGLRTPMVWVQHADPSHQVSARDHRIFPVVRWSASQLHALVFVSELQKRRWREHGLGHSVGETIFNGVDLQRFNAPIAGCGCSMTREQFGFGPRDVVFGVCASLRPEKNHLAFVRAVHTLRERGIPAKGLIIGDGVMREAIEAEIAGLRLDEHVSLTGALADVRPALSVLDAGVLCSDAETFSLAALEMMASGLPMVMSDVGGASELVGDGVGFVYPRGHQAELANCMARLAEPGVARTMGAAARRRVELHFSYDTMLASYRRLLMSLVAPTAPKAS